MTRTTPPWARIAITITSAPKPVTFAVANPRASAPPPHCCAETQRYKGCRGHKFAQAESTTAPLFFGGTCSAAIPTRDLHVTGGKCHVTPELWTSGWDLLWGRERGGEWGDFQSTGYHRRNTITSLRCIGGTIFSRQYIVCFSVVLFRWWVSVRSGVRRGAGSRTFGYGVLPYEWCLGVVAITGGSRHCRFLRGCLCAYRIRCGNWCDGARRRVTPQRVRFDAGTMFCVCTETSVGQNMFCACHLECRAFL